ncbi:MAG: cobalamin biosynthesis protein [Desulfurococcales archaeon]|nr:cobalamin biosynthesis protein [Desulfurococcales archaeon]
MHYLPPWVLNKYNPIAVLAALALDYLYPRHEGLALALHPVHTAFLMARRLAPPYSGAARGVASWLAVMATHLAPAALLLYASWRLLGPPGWVVAAALVYKASIAVRLLALHASRASRALREGRLGDARREAQNLVRRPTATLGPGHVASAVIESLAESLVDSVASPLFYAAILGPLGALAQRIANTLDGALGFKTPQYIRAGKASAYADTILNYIPARLAALTIALTAPLAGGSTAEALKTIAANHAATESRNAGYPLSAIAGALGVCLEKKGHYTINPGKPCPNPDHINKAIHLLYTNTLIWITPTLHP